MKISCYCLLFLIVIQIKVNSQENSIEKSIKIRPQEVIIKNIEDEIILIANIWYIKENEIITWNSSDSNIAEIKYSKICEVMEEDYFENNVLVSMPCTYIQSKGEGEAIITFKIKKDNKVIEGQSKIIVKREKIIGSLYKLKNNIEGEPFQKITDEERFFVRFEKSKPINKIVFKLYKALPLQAKINILSFDQPKGGYSEIFKDDNISKLNCNKSEKTCEVNFFNKRYSFIRIEFLGLPFDEKFLENMEIYGYD